MIYAGSPHVGDRGVTKIMEPESRNLRSSAGCIKCGLNGINRLTLNQKNKILMEMRQRSNSKPHNGAQSLSCRTTDGEQVTNDVAANDPSPIADVSLKDREKWGVRICEGFPEEMVVSSC